MERQLTQRETMALQLASQGLSDKEIAREQNCSLYTAKDRMQNIYFKLCVRNRTQAVAKGFRHQLLHSFAIALVAFSALNDAQEQLRPRQTRNPHSSVYRAKRKGSNQ